MNHKYTKGEATVARISVFGRQTISVGILGTKKTIAICGFVGEPDEAESEANAIRIANEWNAGVNERLRDALQRIAGQAVCVGMDGPSGDGVMLKNCYDIAESALANGEVGRAT